MTFQLLRLKGSPVIAFPAGPRWAKRAALARVNGFTPKRWAFVSGMRLGILLGADRVLMETVRDPLQGLAGFGLTDLLAELRAHLGRPASFAAVLWPWPPGSYRGRVYVHAFDEEARPIAFCKLSIDESQDAKLANEARMLSVLGVGQGRTMRVPCIVAEGTIAGRRYLATEPLPVGIRPVAKRSPSLLSVLDELRVERNARMDEIAPLAWWREIQVASDEHPWLVQALTSRVCEHGLDVSLVHGDFGAKNVVACEDRLYLLDWEAGSVCGPKLTDHVSYFLSLAGPALRRDPARLHRHIVSGLAGRLEYGALDVVAALFYLDQAGCRAVRPILAYLERIRPGMNQDA